MTCEFIFKCDKTWESLSATKNPKVRDCDACGKQVHFCTTQHQVLACAKKQQCVCYAPIDTSRFENPLSFDYPFKDDKPFKVIPNEPLLEGIERLKKEGVDVEQALRNAEPFTSPVTLGLPSFDIDPPDSLPIRLNEMLSYTKALDKTETLLKNAIETIIVVLIGIAAAIGIIQIVTGTLVDILYFTVFLAATYGLFKTTTVISLWLNKRSLQRSILDAAQRASNAFLSIKNKKEGTHLLTGLNEIDTPQDDIATLRKAFSREA